MEIDPGAPVKVRSEVAVEAEIATVWQLVAAIEDWPKWNPDVTSAVLDGPMTPGTVFRWRAKRMSIVSTLELVEAPHRIGWTGRSIGVRAVHTCHLEERNGIVVVTTEESMRGWLVTLFSGSIEGMLEKSLAAWGRHLKTAAERS